MRGEARRRSCCPCRLQPYAPEGCSSYAPEAATLRTRGCNPPHQKAAAPMHVARASVLRAFCVTLPCEATPLTVTLVSASKVRACGKGSRAARCGASRGAGPGRFGGRAGRFGGRGGSGAARAAGQQGGGVAGRRGAKGGGAPRAAGRDGRAARASRIRFSSSTAYPGLEVSAGSLAAACLSTSCMASSRALSVFSREYRISLD